MIVTQLLKIQNQLKVYHWQTKGKGSYAQHKALDGAFDSMVDLIDEFVEVFMGKYGRIKGPFKIDLNDFESLNTVTSFLDDSINFLVKELPSKLNDETDTDLLNVRDEMLAALNKLKYLLTLE